MSCIRVYDYAPSILFDLRGIPACQAMCHTFQCNLVPRDVVEDVELMESAVSESKTGRHGIDSYWLGGITHKLGRINFVSMESWVAHEGVGVSVVEKQGYPFLKTRGYNLVEELRKQE